MNFLHDTRIQGLLKQLEKISVMKIGSLKLLLQANILFTTKASGRANAANENFLHRERKFSFPNYRRESYWGKEDEKKVWVELK